MRAMILVAFLLILILLLTMLGVWYLDSSAGTICRQLQPMEKALSGENFEQARNCYLQAQKSWQKTQKYWRTMIDHEDMRDIEVAFVDLNTALEEKDAATARQELAELLFFIQHVPDSEQVRLDNIL